MSAKFDVRARSHFEDDWHFTSSFWEWPRTNKEELKRRLSECEMLRMQGCQRPNIAPCQEPWVFVKFYFNGDIKPHTSKVCRTSPKGEHWSHLFGWTSGWSKCEMISQEGEILEVYT